MGYQTCGAPSGCPLGTAPFKVIESIAEFVAFCRMQGFLIGTQQVKESIQLVELGHLEERIFKISLRAICCKNKDEFDRFHSIFDIFWRQKKLAKKRDKIKHQHKPKKTPASLIWLGEGRTGSQESQNEAKEVTGANTVESLKQIDFSAVKEIDAEALDKLALQLWQQMSLRLKRRKKKKQRGSIDLRKTLRKNISNGGWYGQLVFREKKKERRKLLLFLDISGSMDKYSFYLLKFIYVLQSYFNSIEVFTFSTRLNRITDMLKKHDLDEVLKNITHELDSWSSGTKISACLNHFVEVYAKRVLSKRCIVVILSDGLETGNLKTLTKSIKEIKKQSKSLIWLNPLKGMKGYEPVQRGMSVALPHVDIFESAHNLNSLLNLEKYLQEV